MNEENNVPIEPYTLVKTSTITSIRIEVNQIRLYNSVTIGVLLFDESGQPIDHRLITIAGADYTNWGNDDDYIINFVLNKLGLTKLPASQISVS